MTNGSEHRRENPCNVFSKEKPKTCSEPTTTFW